MKEDCPICEMYQLLADLHVFICFICIQCFCCCFYLGNVQEASRLLGCKDVRVNCLDEVRMHF